MLPNYILAEFIYLDKQYLFIRNRLNTFYSPYAKPKKIDKVRPNNNKSSNYQISVDKSETKKKMICTNKTKV